MGIKNLNRYFLEKCSDKSIRKMGLHLLKGKKVAIDTSIYLYKFLAEDALMEQMYLLISVFLHYHIQPIFVFDGKTPPEKRALVHRRRLEKKAAINKYAEICDGSQPPISKMEMRELERKMLRLTWEDIDNVRDLLEAYGVRFVRAPGEADHMCAHLVKTGEAWATMTEDMDLFLYGCPRVLRGLNMQTREIILYDTSAIMTDLQLSQEQFLMVMVIFGTDYNEGAITMMNRTTIEGVIKDYIDYIKDTGCIENETENTTKNKQTTHFYQWLTDKNKLKLSVEMCTNTCEIFQRVFEECNTNTDDAMTTTNNTVNIIESKNTVINKNYNKLSETPANWYRINKILKPYGFVFLT